MVFFGKKKKKKKDAKIVENDSKKDGRSTILRLKQQHQQKQLQQQQQQQQQKQQQQKEQRQPRAANPIINNFPSATYQASISRTGSRDSNGSNNKELRKDYGQQQQQQQPGRITGIIGTLEGINTTALTANTSISDLIYNKSITNNNNMSQNRYSDSSIHQIASIGDGEDDFSEIYTNTSEDDDDQHTDTDCDIYHDYNHNSDKNNHASINQNSTTQMKNNTISSNTSNKNNTMNGATIRKEVTANNHNGMTTQNQLPPMSPPSNSMPSNNRSNAAYHYYSNNNNSNNVAVGKNNNRYSQNQNHNNNHVNTTAHNTTIQTQPPSQPITKQSQESITRDLVKKFIADIWNRGELDLIQQVCSPSIRFNGNAGLDKVGHNGFARMVATIHNALYDYHCEIHSMVVEENKAFCRLRFTGRHTGNLLGYEPTNKVVSWMGATEFTIKEGRIMKVWELGDMKTLEEQLRS